MAATTEACQGIWLQHNLLGDTGSSATLLVDNESEIQVCKNHVFHGRSKHIETRFHFICECVLDGKIAVDYVHTGEQLADIMTKALTQAKFQELRGKLCHHEYQQMITGENVLSENGLFETICVRFT